METNTCESCIWYPQCGEAQLCEDYSPLAEEHETEYENNLEACAGSYQECLEELNGPE